MKHIWRFTINQFLVATRDNYKKAHKLSSAHNNRLKSRMDSNPGDPDYAFVYNRYHPLHVELSKAYSVWKAKEGIQKGETLTVKQLLKLLPARINKIDLKIQQFHDKGSPRYVQLFPQDHKPFYRGSQESRISALAVLSKSIGSETDLAPAKLMTDNLLDELNLAKKEQSGAKLLTSSGRSRIEKARIEAMIGQYQDVGFFINKFPREPKLMEILFDVSTLTNPEQKIWKGQLEPGEVKALLVRTFDADDAIRAKCMGEGSISLFLATYTGATDSKSVTIDTNRSLKFKVARFEAPDLSQYRFMTLVNNSDSKAVRFLVQLY
jgi:hypothetical protein